MGHSSLLGTDDAPETAPGRDTRALGPSDTSDSGSDLVGIDDFDDADPSMPVDVAAGEDMTMPDTTSESLGADTDASGTGERASAAGSGLREGGDIGVDRIVQPHLGGDIDGDIDDSLGLTGDDAVRDALGGAAAGDPLEDDGGIDAIDAAIDGEDDTDIGDALPEDESADPVGTPRQGRTAR